MQSDGGDRWVTPQQTFVDLPFRDTGLSALYPRVALRWRDGSGFAYDREPYPLAGYYSEVEGVEEFLEIVGAQVGIVITQANVYENVKFSWSWRVNNRETRQGVNVDWGIEFLEKIIESGSPGLLRSLWHAVHSSPHSKAIATYQANRTARTYKIDSQLAQVLKERAWVLDRHGALRTPREMTNDDLPDDWAKPTDGSFVMKLDFGSNANVLRAREHIHTQQLRRLGLDDEDLAAVMEFKAAGGSAEDIFRMARERSADSRFPVGASDDPDRRAGTAARDALNAPHHATEVRERSVVVGQKQATDESKAYLRAHYTNESGDMFCQACQKPLPFRTKDGWYFEAVRFVAGRRQIHTANAIALCHLCAALYKHARATDDEQLSVTLMDRSQGTVVVPVVLDGKRVRIVFTEKHAIDIQVAMRVAGDDRKL
ncbi:MAG: hypothetical protein HQ453_09385 [Actinobacteria bacterium]|nr:hypothetical protein [Actinomycetota bacterium]